MVIVKIAEHATPRATKIEESQRSQITLAGVELGSKTRNDLISFVKVLQDHINFIRLNKTITRINIHCMKQQDRKSIR